VQAADRGHPVLAPFLPVSCAAVAHSTPVVRFRRRSQHNLR